MSSRRSPRLPTYLPTRPNRPMGDRRGRGFASTPFGVGVARDDRILGSPRLKQVQMTRTVDMVAADQRVVSGEVCGPVTIQIEGWEPVSSEVTFVDMELEGGRYRPLLGYTVLEQAGLAADPVGGRLLKIPHMDLRAASASTG